MQERRRIINESVTNRGLLQQNSSAFVVFCGGVGCGGRGPRAPPKSTHIRRRDTWVPPYKGISLHRVGRRGEGAPPNGKRGRLRARVFRVKREKERNLSKIRVPRRYSSVHSSVSSATNHTGISMAVTRLRGVMFPVKRHTKV